MTSQTILANHVTNALGADVILSHQIIHDELVLRIAPTTVTDVLRFLRDDPQCSFEILMDLTAVDTPAEPERFTLVYNLLSLTHKHRTRVTLSNDGAAPVASVTSLFSCANWYEREVWDMFGILFSGHPDLRRILTDYGFEGHPLRKDFPLTGHVELRFDEAQQRVVYEPVHLAQDYRNFDALSPWEGMTDVHKRLEPLPGDEKASA